MELTNQHADGTFLNRFALNGQISALGWLQAEGFPSFRLFQQLRMAKNMFQLAQKLSYNDDVLRYGSGTDPSLTIGRRTTTDLMVHPETPAFLRQGGGV